MPRYLVTIIEYQPVIRRSKVFTAPTEEDAADLAEAEDWSDWELDCSSDDPEGETFIESVEDEDEEDWIG